MGILTAGRLDHLVDDMFWRWLVRITHAEVDNIFAAMTCLHLQVVDDAENVGRKPVNSGKFVIQVSKIRTLKSQ